jgi:hypothetical protein
MAAFIVRPDHIQQVQELLKTGRAGLRSAVKIDYNEQL